MQAGSDNGLGAVQFTCRLTAAYRTIELRHPDGAILDDPLAPFLAGEKALKYAEEEVDSWCQSQGSGKHLRVPARARILEDTLLGLLSERAALQIDQTEVQVVCLGAGMDTTPWRLSFPCKVHYFEVDFPEVVGLKQRLLSEAHASTAAGDQASSAARFPLKCASWSAVGADTSKPDWVEHLIKSGYNRDVWTVWLAEGLIYYLTLPDALKFLRTAADACPTGSRLIATCVDRELLEGNHKRSQGHAFNQLWHFCMDDLQGGALERAGWRIGAPQLPETTRKIALERYHADTYVPSYGGSECIFTAEKL